MKLKIIHIMTHPQAYEEFSDKPRPAINWDTTDGSWVGIWGNDWSDQLSVEVRKINDDMVHEIWQPDFRADKIYSHEIFPGVIHRLFPAEELRVRVGLKKITLPYSPQMKTFSNKDSTVNIIFHIGQSITCPVNKSLIDYYTGHKFIFSFHGQISLPYDSLLRLQKNILAKYYYLIEHYRAKNLFSKIDYVTYMNSNKLCSLKYYYKGKIKMATMGIHFDRYQCYDKTSCRKELNLPFDRKILLYAGRLNSQKQIDKLIGVLSKIDQDFLFVVVGHGTRSYEDYLIEEATSLFTNNKFFFAGYKSGEALIKYFKSADLYIQISQSEGASVAVMEAMACGLPIFCTDTGNTAELLKANNAGVVVGTDEYDDWKEKLIQYFNGTPIKTLDTEIVRDNYEWSIIAKRFSEIYKEV